MPRPATSPPARSNAAACWWAFRLARRPDGPIVLVHVRRVVPGGDDDATPLSLRLDASVWTRANASLGDDETVVGWFHSHPGLGAFFSDTDRRTQADFFPRAFSLGWVVDPVRGEHAWLSARARRLCRPGRSSWCLRRGRRPAPRVCGRIRARHGMAGEGPAVAGEARGRRGGIDSEGAVAARARPAGSRAGSVPGGEDGDPLRGPGAGRGDRGAARPASVAAARARRDAVGQPLGQLLRDGREAGRRGRPATRPCHQHRVRGLRGEHPSALGSADQIATSSSRWSRTASTGRTSTGWCWWVAFRTARPSSCWAGAPTGWAPSTISRACGWASAPSAAARRT